MTDTVITLDRSVVEQALEALTNCTSEYSHRCNRCDSEVDPDGNVASALRAALEPQVEQEPVAWMYDSTFMDGTPLTDWLTSKDPREVCLHEEDVRNIRPLYTHPQPPRQPQVELDRIEQYRLQMAAIMTAALGYWKEGDSIHPDYDTVALRDVAKLYAKYDELFNIVHGIGGEK